MVGTRVYVGGLPYGVREKDLERFFKGYGRIRDVLIKNGYGFCEFDDYRDADDAVYELNGKELLGERVIVEHARGTARRERGYGGGGGYGRRRSSWMDKDMDVRIHDRYGPPTRTEYRLVVENLSSRVSWQDLKDYMRQAGEVTYADAHKQRRNEGVVEFATHSDMRNAIDKLDDTELNGRRIRLIEDTRRSGGRRRSRSSSSRSHSRSRSRSRRRSRTRSRSRSRRSSRSRSRSHRSSRSKSRGGSKSKSASRSKSRSRSKSKSKTGTSVEKLEYQQSPSNSAQAHQLSPSRERSKSKSRSQSRSRSRSEPKNNRSKSRSQSKSKAKSRSKDRSRSRSASKGHSKSKSRSHSPEKDGDDKSPDDKKHD